MSMTIKKLVALMTALSVLCCAIPMVMTASAAEVTLTEAYEEATHIVGDTVTGTDDNRAANTLIRFTDSFDLRNSSASWLYEIEWCKTLYDMYGAGYTCTNAYGYEVAVNQYGYVTAVSAEGNMKIPAGGFVLSGVDEYHTNLKNNVAVGDRLLLDANGQYHVYKVTDDDKLLGESITFSLPYTQVKGGSYAGGITIGGDGVTTPSGDWETDVLVKITGAGANASRYAGYVVKVGGNHIAVPEGYFAISLPGQIMNDNGTKPYNAAQLFHEFASVGTLVNCGDNEVFFRHDAAAAQRAAALLTGTGDMVYDYSASAMVNDAYDKFELVDIDRMQALYDNMQAITETVSGMTDMAALKPYMATLYQNYAELQKLEFEVRTVEMRATWMRPLPNDRKERTKEELDALLTDSIVSIKNQGYNMIFVETFYNSTTIFPVPETVGYAGISFKQNPYLVPASEGGLNHNLTETYDMLQRFVEICEENDVEPHIWWEVFYVGYKRTNGLTDSLFEYSVAQTILDDLTTYNAWLNKASNGDLFYGAETDGALQYFLNPASTGARTFLMNTFEYVWKTYDIKSFQLDYIRYPHTNEAKCFGYDDDTLAAFKAAYPNNTADLYSYAGFYDEEWVQFRANFVTSFVEEIRAKMQEIAPAIYLTSSPGADPADSKKNLMQDVTYWLQNDLIDIIFPMAYGVNIPGNVTAGLVADNSEHFVCTGVSGSYLDNDVELRWAKEIRDAGADGLAAFGEIPDYADYVWSKPAVTPIGNAARAARTYLSDTVNARADLMLKLGAIDEDTLSEIKAATAAADKAIRFYGIKSEEALTAINALQAIADTLTTARAAMTKDIHYLLKIRNNARDDLAQASDAKTSKATLTVNGTKVIDGGQGFTYVAATETLYVTANGAVLSGDMPENVTLVLSADVDTIELSDVTFTSEDAAIEASSDLTIDLTGVSTLGGKTLANVNCTYIGTGELYIDDTLVMCKGDVDGSEALDSNDLRAFLLHNVKAETFTEEQILVGDANGDGKVNTVDTRIFLAKMVETL